MVTLSAVLLIAAILLFLAAAFGVPARRVNLGWLGAACWATSFFISTGGL